MGRVFNDKIWAMDRWIVRVLATLFTVAAGKWKKWHISSNLRSTRDQ